MCIYRTITRTRRQASTSISFPAVQGAETAVSSDSSCGVVEREAQKNKRSCVYSRTDPGNSFARGAGSTARLFTRFLGCSGRRSKVTFTHVPHSRTTHCYEHLRNTPDPGLIADAESRSRVCCMSRQGCHGILAEQQPSKSLRIDSSLSSYVFE